MHETVIIEVAGIKREVDKELATLIQTLDHLGIKTTNCCQGDRRHRGYISIQLGEHTHFEFYPEKNVLTIRWVRPEYARDSLPVESFFHTETGVVRASEMN